MLTIEQQLHGINYQLIDFHTVLQPRIYVHTQNISSQLDEVESSQLGEKHMG